MTHESRLRILNANPVNDEGNYVLYWMQSAQRTHHNDALEYAIERANELGKPVVVCFGLMDDYPEANERSYAFLLEGLRDVETALRARKILFVVKHGPGTSGGSAFWQTRCTDRLRSKLSSASQGVANRSW